MTKSDLEKAMRGFEDDKKNKLAQKAFSAQSNFPLAVLFIKKNSSITKAEIADWFKTNEVDIFKPINESILGLELIGALADLKFMIGTNVEDVAFAIGADAQGFTTAILTDKFDDWFYFTTTEQVELLYRLYKAYEEYDRGARIANEIKEYWIYGWQQVMTDLLSIGYTSNNLGDDTRLLDAVEEKKDGLGRALEQLLSKLRPQ
jgi:hypothetical protein